MGELTNVLLARLAPVHERCDSLRQAWDYVLPANLKAHCRIGQIKGGCLRIDVDTASYMYELQLCRDELLKELQRLCPGTGLRRVQVAMAQGR